MAIVIPSIYRSGNINISPTNYPLWYDTANTCSGVLLFYSDDVAGQIRRARISDGTRVYDSACGTNTWGAYMVSSVFGQQAIAPWAMRAAGIWTSSIQFTHQIVLKNNVYVDGGGRPSYFCSVFRPGLGAQIGADVHSELVTGIGGAGPVCATGFTNSYSVTVYDDGSITVP